MPPAGPAFELLSAITKIQTLASGSAIRERRRLAKAYGVARWRKLKGSAWIRLSDGTITRAEVHWYEATGVGRKEFKIKRFLL